MNNNKVKVITQGAMLAALFGVMGLINIVIGSFLDMLICYFIAIATALYTYKYDYKAGIVLALTTSVILFIIGELFFMAFCSTTMLMGVYFGALLQRGVSDNITFIGMYIISLIKNFILFYVLGSFLGYDIVSETTQIVHKYGMAKNESTIFIVLFILITWLLMGVVEVIIISGYSMRIYQRAHNFIDKL